MRGTIPARDVACGQQSNQVAALQLGAASIKGGVCYEA